VSGESVIKEELYLIIGCFGRVDDGFVSCASCENKILKLDAHIEDYNGVMSYLDTCRLFDKPTFDFNSIRHIIHNMQDRFDQVASGRRLWDEKQIQLYQKFIIDHRLCGLYLKLALIPKDIPKDPDEEIQETPEIEEKSIKVVAHSSQRKLVAAPKVNLKFIRGRR
jgi:hypothetical protein